MAAKKANNSQKTTPAAPTSTHDVLQQKGFAAESALLNRKTVSTNVEEGKRYTIDLGEGKPSVVYKVDGNIITQGSKCDRLVLIQTASTATEEEWLEIFVEQKGTDVKHAYEQLRDTIKLAIFKHASNKKRRACVVATSFPANGSDPAIEKIKTEIAGMKVQYKQFKNGQKDKL